MTKDRLSSRIGALAIDRGLITQAELDGLIARARADGRSSARRALIGELLVRERYVSARLLEELLEEQRLLRKGASEAARASIAAPPPTPPPESTLEDLLGRARALKAQELLLVAGKPPALRVADVLRVLPGRPLEGDRHVLLVAAAFTAAEREAARGGVAITRTHVARAGRFRAILTPSEQGSSLSFRPIGIDPKTDGIDIPREIAHLAELKRGLVIVTGSRSFHRRAVLAHLVDLMNDRSRRHVITIDRTIVYEHESRRCLIAQREVGAHTRSYATALRSSLRQDPDVLAIGELSDPEGIATALLSAETGHLVLCSLHAPDGVQAVRRMIDAQAASKRSLVRATLANTIQAIVVVESVPLKDGHGRHLVADVIPGTPAVARVIREDRYHNLLSIARAQEGAVSRDSQLVSLYDADKISRIAALEAACECSNIDRAKGPARGRLAAGGES